MTLQEIYDKVKTHLLTQNERSVDLYDFVCKYRGPRGLMCAAGCLIPDELYLPTLEGRAADGLNVANVLAQAGVLGPAGAERGQQLSLIRKLQVIHDSNLPQDWPELLTDLAITKGLTP